MNIQDYHILLQIQALQGLGGSVNPTAGTDFQTVLSDVVNAGSKDQTQQLGSVLTQINEAAARTSMLPSVTFPAAAGQAPAAVHSPAAVQTGNTAYGNIIREASQLYQLPEKLIKSVIQQESGFNAQARSSAGASGLMQLMPATARGLGVKDIFNPSENIMAGTKYLSQMMKRYNGNTELALAAYNAGPGNVDKYGGIPPFKETSQYVSKVMNAYLS